MAPFARTTLPAHLKPDIGRPNEYDPAYCDQVLEFMSQGYSLTAFAGSIRKARQTVYRWMREHAAFSDAVTRAQACRVTALETKLLRSRKGAETTAAIFALRNADPTEWKDVRSVKHDHNHTVDTLTDAQLYAIAAGDVGAGGAVIDAEYEDITTR